MIDLTVMSLLSGFKSFLAQRLMARVRSSVKKTVFCSCGFNELGRDIVVSLIVFERVRGVL